MKLKILHCSFTLLLLLAAAHNSSAQNLKKTVHRFIKVITDTKATEQQFITQLKPFIDPAANVDSLCTDYYQYWKRNADLHSFPVNTKIEKIEPVNTVTATVYISNIWQMGEEDRYYFLSETFWVYKNNQWYRSGKGAVRLEKRKL